VFCGTQRRQMDEEFWGDLKKIGIKVLVEGT
jgi:hypothetical protein